MSVYACADLHGTIHKTDCIRLPAPRPLIYRRHHNWGQIEEERCFEF